MKSKNKLIHKLDHLDVLPAIPSIAREILSLKTHTDEGLKALLELVNDDPVILAKVIGLANSPVFGTGRKILNLNDSVALLGTSRINMIALNFALQSALTGKQTGKLNIQELWQHSLAVAITMDLLAQYMPDDNRPSDNEIYLVGLLHDIGYLVLKTIDSKLSDKLHTRIAEDPNRPLLEIELEVLEGIDHGELGSLLAKHWKLPASIVDTLKYHNIPNESIDTNVKQLVDMIRLSEKLLPDLSVAENNQINISSKEWQLLGIDPRVADEITKKVNQFEGGLLAG